MSQVIWNSDIDVYDVNVMPLLIALNISQYLAVPELLTFARVSRNALKTVNDPTIWISRLRAMGLWDSAFVPPLHTTLEPSHFAFLQDPLTCLDHIIKYPKIAKLQLVRIHNILNPYYTELLHHKSYDNLRIFKDFSLPQDQAKILSNLLVFIEGDPCWESRSIAQETLESLCEVFENAILRELEIHYEIKDYDLTSKFAKILINLKNDETLISFFLQKLTFDNMDNTVFDLKRVSKRPFFVKQLKSTTESRIDSEGRIDSESRTEIDSGSDPKIRTETDSENDLETASDSETRNETASFSETASDLKTASDSETASDSKTSQNFYTIDSKVFHQYILEISETFNSQSQIIDKIFPPTLPMMSKVCEELVSNQIKDVIATIIAMAQERKVFLMTVPFLYKLFQVDFPALLLPSINAGDSYSQCIKELFDNVFESVTAEYMRLQVLEFHDQASLQISTWQQNVLKREQETSRNILKLVKEETKPDLLASFKKVFTITAGTSSKGSQENEANYSKMEAKAKILSENISLLDKILSPELVLNVLDQTKTALTRLSKFKEYSIVNIQNDIYAQMQLVFITVIELVGDVHLRPGFEKAIQYLLTYNPLSKTFTSTHVETFERPLQQFFELSNLADLIIQMIHLFYREEMIAPQFVKNENSILNPALQSKKKLELTVDNFIAQGLEVSVDVLVNEIESVYKNGRANGVSTGNSLCLAEYDPPVVGSTTFGTTPAAQQAVKILEQNINLLGDSADKSIVDVFQQEMAERFFQIVVKVLKNSTVSVVGATNLILDLNLYYDFIVDNIKSNKRAVLPLFQSLKKVGNIYLIGGSDSKAIAKLTSDLSKFNGIFTQEEIYEFVQQRKDWVLIKKNVEKVLFGFGLVDCCLV